MKTLENIMGMARSVALAGMLGIAASYATGCEEEEEESPCCQHTECSQTNYVCDDILHPQSYDEHCVLYPDGEKECCECEYREPQEDDNNNDDNGGWEND